MTTMEREITGPGGRTLLVHEAGDPDGALVVYHHGTPQSGLMLESWEDHAATSRVRLVSYDRPGYGGSTPQPGRTVADAAVDVAAIAAALGAARLFGQRRWRVTSPGRGRPGASRPQPHAR